LLAIRPAKKVIRTIELRRAAGQLPRPRVSAITCEVEDRPVTNEEPEKADGGALVVLDPVAASPDDLQWIADHTLSADGPNWQELADEIRRARTPRITSATRE
jgi:hypothetical protein